MCPFVTTFQIILIHQGDIKKVNLNRARPALGKTEPTTADEKGLQPNTSRHINLFREAEFWDNIVW